jgi:hypothetical protein
MEFSPVLLKTIERRSIKSRMGNRPLIATSRTGLRGGGIRSRMGNKSAPEGEAEHEGACKGGDEVGWREDIAVESRMDGGCRRIWRREGGVRIGD